MKKVLGNKGLLDKKRFEPMEEERRRWLRGLTMKESIRLTEKMLRTVTPECREESDKDWPVCFKLLLKRMRNAARQRRRRAALKRRTSHQ